MMNGLALFAGIGGIEVGLRRWIRTVCYVEWDDYAIAVLRSRIKEGKIDDAPIWDDVTTFKGMPWRDLVDIISLGFPCQDISTAGKGRGIKEDTRSGLWFQGLRIINEIRPSFVFVENVSALTNRGLDIVLGCLSEAGYNARWTDLRASDVGAKHRRERLFILAYTTRDVNKRINDIGEIEEKPKSYNTLEFRIPERECLLSEGFVNRRNDGVPYWMDRIKCLGNSVVPRQAERAWEILTNLEGYSKEG